MLFSFYMQLLVKFENLLSLNASLTGFCYFLEEFSFSLLSEIFLYITGLSFGGKQNGITLSLSD